MKMELIHIQGFKSIADLRMENADLFAVFAGPNGAGKSNLADALAFFGAVVKRGVSQAIRDFGGFAQINCFKHGAIKARTASLELKVKLSEEIIHFQMKISQMDNNPTLAESLSVNGVLVMERMDGATISIHNKGEAVKELEDFPAEMSALMLYGSSPMYHFMTNIRVFRFDPLGAKEPDSSTTDSTALDTHGRNVATMLSVLEKDSTIRSQILEWIELLVPGMVNVSTKKQSLDGTTIITFKEKGLATRLPARLISDGTIYALCIMSAILSRSDALGMTIIEEPERGIHPNAIAELVSLMRDNAQSEHPIFITTHSESIVRSSRVEELWLMNKVAGKTTIKNATDAATELGSLNLDKAWLMNFFDGGLPW